MTNGKARIEYRDFYDVPRIFLASHRGTQYLFDCKFDEDLDEYPDAYQVFVMPRLEAKDLSGSWDSLPALATKNLGEVPVKSVRFDRTLRCEIDTKIIDELLARR